MHLSMFLEVTDPRNQEADWSCFVSHRLSVINQHRDSDKSVSKESQNRYSKAAKDWGWREFVTLTSLFDTDLGFLVGDTVVLCAEVRDVAAARTAAHALHMQRSGEAHAAVPQHRTRSMGPMAAGGPCTAASCCLHACGWREG
jgi:hypothetical protein